MDIWLINMTNALVSAYNEYGNWMSVCQRGMVLPECPDHHLLDPGGSTNCYVGCLQLKDLTEDFAVCPPRVAVIFMSCSLIPSANAWATSLLIRHLGSSTWARWAKWLIAVAKCYRDSPSWVLLFSWEWTAASRQWSP
jgi:hypothetical protein